MEFNKNKKTTRIFKGDIYYADLGSVIGSEQGGIRPVIIVQNNIGNKFSPTVIAAPVTSRHTKAKLPTHLELRSSDTGLNEDSIALFEQIRTIDKSRLKERAGSIKMDFMPQIDEALSISFGMA